MIVYVSLRVLFLIYGRSCNFYFKCWRKSLIFAVRYQNWT